jgi:sugar/nucleoside kinase (ribokinase family)
LTMRSAASAAGAEAGKVARDVAGASDHLLLTPHRDHRQRRRPCGAGDVERGGDAARWCMSPPYPVRMRDVLGAGDTIAAALAGLLATGADFEAATRAANAAASVVVGSGGRRAREVVRSAGRVVGVDVSESIIKTARDRAAAQNLAVEF